MENSELIPLRISVADTLDWLVGDGERGKLVRAIDWVHTVSGPIESWPQSLRTTVGLCFDSNFPVSIAWGLNQIQIYNDGYWPICGGMHPHSMGQDFSECRVSAWPVIGESFERAVKGETFFPEDQRMFLDRNGYFEETFFTLFYLIDSKGETARLIAQSDSLRTSIVIDQIDLRTPPLSNGR